MIWLFTISIALYVLAGGWVVSAAVRGQLSSLLGVVLGLPLLLGALNTTHHLVGVASPAGGMAFWHPVLAGVIGGLTVALGRVLARGARGGTGVGTDHHAQVLAEHIRDGLWIWDAERDAPEFISPGMGRLWGVSAEAMMADPALWLACVHEGDRVSCSRHMASAIRDGHFEDEYRIVRPGGEVRWVRCRGRLFVDPEDGRKKVAGTTEDITERHEMQAALASSERRFREIAETVREAFWVASADVRQIEYISPAYETLLGRSAEALLRDGEDWYRAVHPEDVGWVREAFETLAEGKEYDATYRVIHPDGTERWVRDRGFPAFAPDGRVERIIGLIQDLTAQKQAEAELRDSEARFREIVETAQEGILLADQSGMVAYANDRMCELLGLGLERVMHQPVDRVLPRQARETLSTLLGARAARGEPRDVRLEHESGRVAEALVSAASLRDYKGATRGYVAMFTDITERRRAERDLLQAQKIEAIGELASGVAHDFNNLLAAIGAHLRLAQSTLEPDHPARRSLESVQAAADQAAGVTRSLLTFSRRSDPERMTVWIGDPIEQTARLLRRAMPARIALDTPRLSRREHPFYIEADPTQLQQALLNLCINARDAMPDGGTIRIEVEHLAETGDAAAGGGRAAVRLTVTDTGAGIPPELRQRVFEPFFTTKSRDDNTGLGLAITHGIVARHGGTIGVASAPGEGTTFTIDLPLVAAPADGDTPAAREPIGQGRFVMIASAHEHVGRLLASVLRSEDYRVELLRSGEALLEHAAERRGEKLLLLDLDGQPMDGLGCLRRLRSSGDASGAILITSSEEAEDDAADLGAAILSKPFQVDDVPVLLSRAARTIRGVGGLESAGGGDSAVPAHAVHHTQTEPSP